MKLPLSSLVMKGTDFQWLPIPGESQTFSKTLLNKKSCRYVLRLFSFIPAHEPYEYSAMYKRKEKIMASNIVNLSTAYLEKDSMYRIANTAYKQLAITNIHSGKPSIN
ncbi:hypothetical protein [Pradoshia eiseniae]|nr:hypothetical protein [Pradoshia eiseniae]